MYIGVPVGYPKSPPVFLLAVDKNIFYVNDELRLLSHQQIANQKNERGQDFVRLKFALLQKEWNPKNQTINSTFNNILQIINRPPLIVPKHEQRNANSNPFQILQNSNQFANQFSGSNLNPLYNPYANNNNNNRGPQNQPPKSQLKRLDSNLVNETVSKLYLDTTQVLLFKQSLQEDSQALDYAQSRQLFLKDHLRNLKAKLQNITNYTEKQSQNIANDIATNERENNCDRFLQISQNEMNKLQIFTQMQVLKEAEVKLRNKIQKETNAKFSEYKKIMRVLYQKMFDNQSKMLMLSK